MNKLYNINSGIQKALIISDDQLQDTSVRFHNKEITTEFIPYELRTIDLGFGPLWCEYNLGAFPENNVKSWYGDYYAWGETETKKKFLWDNYIYYDKEDKMLKYNSIDEKTVLEQEDDIVNKLLGSQYRMPTKEDINKLLENTTGRWIENYNNIQGLNGILFTSKKNEKTLFFPATGYMQNRILFQPDFHGYIWSSTVKKDWYSRSFCLKLGSTGESSVIKEVARYTGFPIRGVKDI